MQRRRTNRVKSRSAILLSTSRQSRAGARVTRWRLESATDHGRQRCRRDDRAGALGAMRTLRPPRFRTAARACSHYAAARAGVPGGLAPLIRCCKGLMWGPPRPRLRASLEPTWGAAANSSEVCQAWVAGAAPPPAETVGKAGPARPSARSRQYPSEAGDHGRKVIVGRSRDAQGAAGIRVLEGEARAGQQQSAAAEQ